MSTGLVGFDVQISSGSSGQVRGGARNMKSMWLSWAAIFFMTYFHRAGGGGNAPLAPPGYATTNIIINQGIQKVTQTVLILKH